MRQKFIAGNWKMNGSRDLAGQMVDALDPILASTDAEVAICPPVTLLQHLQEICEGTAITVGAQNVHHQASGAFTGEISAPMLQEWDIKWCIVGHSERRSLFSESNLLIGEKIAILLQHDILPILCVGETIEQRESGRHEEVVVQQLQEVLSGLAAKDQRLCVVAYEPIWAIGTGKTASTKQANSMHTLIRHHLRELSTEDIAEETQILYGGSVNASNAKDLLKQPDIDGALVGGASLNINEFPSIIVAAG